MNKIEAVKERFNLPYLVANDVVKFVQQSIIEQLQSHIEFVQSDGDLFEITAGLKRAIQLISDIETEGI